MRASEPYRNRSSAHDLPGQSRLQDLRAGHVLEQLGPVQEIRGSGLPLAEELLGLIVPVAAVPVVALAQRNDRKGLWRVGHDDDQGRGLSSAANHRLATRRRVEADGARR